MHHGDLPGRAAEADERDMQPDVERLAERTTMPAGRDTCFSSRAQLRPRPAGVDDGPAICAPSLAVAGACGWEIGQ